ncbi:MAG TPA: hypothetical protein VFC68_00520 [Treponemataceae bacterium]|nr:hypothetical protein [Treponemataceae bacterium]
MILFEKTQVMNFENAMRGARNPMNSWAKTDSITTQDGLFIFGPNDLDLAQRLCKAGSDHRKFIRQIFISVDITAPLYWWKEFDTYKIGTVANSTSTMHKIHSKPFSMDDFSTDRMLAQTKEAMSIVIKTLEDLRLSYVSNKNKDTWYSMIQFLPSSYNQKRTLSMNYENIFNMYHSRNNHTLDEWKVFCNWILKLPYVEDLFGI